MSKVHRRVTVLLALLATALCAPLAAAQERFITVASTTSTDQSGLFAHLLPRFTAQTGIAVRVVALGTGQALDVGRRGDADVVLVHDQPAEEKFVAEGAGGPRHQVMYRGSREDRRTERRRRGDAAGRGGAEPLRVARRPQRHPRR
jgi:tungstate transport system substrate-binding protein